MIYKFGSFLASSFNNFYKDENFLTYTFESDDMDHHRNARTSNNDFQVSRTDNPHFTYGLNDPYGPPRWGRINENCDGERQSPIDIDHRAAKKGHCYNSVVIHGIRKVPSSIEALNNGHSFVIRFNYADGIPAQITGGPLQVPYIIDK